MRELHMHKAKPFLHILELHFGNSSNTISYWINSEGWIIDAIAQVYNKIHNKHKTTDNSPHWPARTKHCRVSGYRSISHLLLQNLKTSHSAKHAINPNRAIGIWYLKGSQEKKKTHHQTHLKIVVQNCQLPKEHQKAVVNRLGT